MIGWPNRYEPEIKPSNSESSNSTSLCNQFMSKCGGYYLKMTIIKNFFPYFILWEFNTFCGTRSTYSCRAVSLQHLVWVIFIIDVRVGWWAWCEPSENEVNTRVYKSAVRLKLKKKVENLFLYWTVLFIAQYSG